MYKLVNHNLRNYFVFVFLVSDVFGALYGENYIHNGSVTHLFRRSIVGKKFLFPIFTNDQNGPQRHLWVFLNRGLSPLHSLCSCGHCTDSSRLQKLLRLLDVCKLKDILC